MSGRYCDAGEGYANYNGFVRVNRIGYWICERPWQDGDNITVEVDGPDNAEEGHDDAAEEED